MSPPSPQDGSLRPAASLERALAGGTIRVGSENPAKLAAVREAFGRFADDAGALVVVGVDVASGVAEQPIGWDEIRARARERARAALASGTCALAVGIEDGLVRLSEASSAGSESDAVFNFGCAWLTDGRREASGFTPGFVYPPGCREPAVRNREPIGDLSGARS